MGPLLSELTTAVQVLIKEFKPDLIASTYPVFSFLMAKIRKKDPSIRMPFYTVITDSTLINSAWYRCPSDGAIVAWGRNYEGQTNVPAPNRGFIAIAAGANHSLAIATPILGDADADRDVDLHDAATLITYLEGPNVNAAVGTLSRLDSDNDTDLDASGTVQPK